MVLAKLEYYWNTYKSIVRANCTDPRVERATVAYWKNWLFAASVIYLIPLSFVAVVPGVYMAYVADIKLLLITDFLAIATIITVAFVPGISVFVRKLLFNGVLYLTSFVLLYYLGSNGPGMLYLFGITIFVLLSLDKKYGYVALGLNILTCLYFAMALYYGFAGTALMSEYRVDAWIAVSSNLIFLSGTAVLIIPPLFDGLESAFAEQKHLSRRLEDSVEDLNAKNRELEDFAYTVSHDLKEPLRMVRSFMQLLKRKYGDKLDQKALMYIQYATDGASRMTGSIDDLLEYSRIGRKRDAIREFDLNNVVSEVTQNLKTDIEAANAVIEVGDLPALRVVPVAITKLFQNLIANGLKYRRRNARAHIKVEAVKRKAEWQFSVTDNGIGIAPEYKDQIFAVFNRLHTRDQYPGNGMGLAICKKIVTRHGGDIWVESEPGRGSVFYFTIKKNLNLPVDEA